MWTKTKWTLRIVAALLALGFLHYTLPQHDVVWITGTDNRPTTLSWENSWAYSSADSGTAENTTSRNIRFIMGAFEDGDVMVYRNEDTGFIWPPYFKFDSATLDAEAKKLTSTSESPKWVVVTHYGWRLPILSIFPNAVSMREAASPDERVIPYVSIVVIAFLLFAIFMIRRIWAQFWERSVEPVAAEMGETWDGVEAKATGFLGRVKAWFNRGRARK